jgi:hypothetical protein
MNAPTHIAAFLAVALLPLIGCDQVATPPSVPSAPTPLAPAGPQGQITVLSVQPESGATLVTEPCEPGATYYCTSEGEPRLTFDVELDQEVTEPWVTASFYNGSQRCVGSGYPTVSQPLEPLAANTTTTFRVSSLSLSLDVNGALICRFPQTTTRMVVQLWDKRGGRFSTSLLTREFAHGYTFVVP